MMEDIYDQFTDEGRRRPQDAASTKLRELAGGRVYTGRQAKENGLIDELGTLHDAIAEAKKLAGLEKDADVRIEVLPEPTNFFESLFGDMDAEKEVRIGQGLERTRAGNDRTSPAGPTACAQVFDQPAALVMPFELEIR